MEGKVEAKVGGVEGGERRVRWWGGGSMKERMRTREVSSGGCKGEEGTERVKRESGGDEWTRRAR